MNKKLWLMMCFVLSMLWTGSVKVYADMGPKPFVKINFKGLEGEEYFATLLSDTNSTGPYEVYDVLKDNDNCKGNKKIWKKFVDFKDEDGYYFLQNFQECSKTSTLEWSYYPPDNFKILIYFPNKNAFLVSSKSYFRYAFESCFEVRLTGVLHPEQTCMEEMMVKKTSEIKWELLEATKRIVMTIIIEMLIALLFGFRSKKQYVVIGVVNTVTQILLNFVLNIYYFKYGQSMFSLSYIGLEILIAMVECMMYCILLNRFSEKKINGKGKIVVYTVVANAISYFIGSTC